MATENESSGVDKLIQRLQDDGVEKGRNAAEDLVAESRKESLKLLDDARREAEEICNKAREEAERNRVTGEEALHLAARDTLLHLQESLRTEFAAKIRRLVAHTLEDKQFLERLILELARKAMPEDAGSSVEILLPANKVDPDDLEKKPEEVSEDSIMKFVLGLSADILREGLTFGRAGDDEPGVRVQIVDQDVQVEFTEQSISGLLMQHMAPRLRGQLEKPAD